MTNNDIFRRVKFAFDFTRPQIHQIFSEVHIEVENDHLSDWLKRENEDTDYHQMSDEQLAHFLNGLIIDRRGKKDDQVPVAEKRMTNNLALRKLKIALNYKDTDILNALKLADFNLGKAELSAFFRASSHKNYRNCQDQVLRYFLNGLYLTFQGKSEDKKEVK